MSETEFSFGWTAMAEPAIAGFEGLLGARPVEVGGRYWRQVRPGFYRPMIQFRPVADEVVPLPGPARLGVAQFAVPAGAPFDSHLNCLIFEHTAAYNLATLDGNRHRQVRQAARKFSVRPITDPTELETQGHAAYLSFYSRTHYEYGRRRRDPQVFARWTRDLLAIPGLLVLGGYQDNRLVGVSISYLTIDTVCYATFFCTTEALKGFLSDLMLHAVRTAAARQPEVRQIYTSMLKGNKGLDGFYQLRGASCVRVPARLRINPLVRLALRLAAPRQYARMLGDVPAGSAQPA